ncbi:MAG: hypothetical protein U0168_25340 [Nannocystaceae bacterium]
MHVHAAARLDGVADLDLDAVAVDATGVADPPAALAVKRRAVQHQLDLGAGAGVIDSSTAGDDRLHRRGRGGGVVAEELVAQGAVQAEVDVGDRGVPAQLGRASPADWRLRSAVGRGLVEREPVLADDDRGEIERSRRCRRDPPRRRARTQPRRRWPAASIAVRSRRRLRSSVRRNDSSSTWTTSAMVAARSRSSGYTSPKRSTTSAQTWWKNGRSSPISVPCRIARRMIRRST